VLLIGKARQVIIRLRLEVGPGDAALGISFKYGQAASPGEGMNQCGDENGLTRSGKSGDAQAQGWIYQAGGQVHQPARSNPARIYDVLEFHSSAPSGAAIIGAGDGE